MDEQVGVAAQASGGFVPPGYIPDRGERSMFLSNTGLWQMFVNEKARIKAETKTRGEAADRQAWNSLWKNPLVAGRYAARIKTYVAKRIDEKRLEAAEKELTAAKGIGDTGGGDAVPQGVVRKQRNANPRDVVDWVFNNIKNPKVDESSAPSLGAVALLEFAKKEKFEFFTKIWPRLLPSRAEVDKAGGRFDDGRELTGVIGRLSAILAADNAPVHPSGAETTEQESAI